MVREGDVFRIPGEGQVRITDIKDGKVRFTDDFGLTRIVSKLEFTLWVQNDQLIPKEEYEEKMEEIHEERRDFNVD